MAYRDFVPEDERRVGRRGAAKLLPDDPARNTTQPVGEPVKFSPQQLQPGAMGYDDFVGGLAGHPNYVNDYLDAQNAAGIAKPNKQAAESTSAAPPANSRETREALGGYAGVGNMLGFNTARDYGGDLKAANSVKNTFGRIASRYGNDAGGIQALLGDADFQRYFPNATYDGKDRINFGGVLSDFESGVPVYDVDVSKGWTGDQGEGWQWLDLVNTGDAGPTGGGGGNAAAALGGMPGGNDIIAALLADGGMGDSGILEQIQAELQRMLSGQAPTTPDYLRGLV